MKKSNNLVSIIMGSKSDWPTMKNTALILEKLKISYECKVVSAHRTPDLLFDYAKSAESRGVEVIIAGAGGAAHLPGMAKRLEISIKVIKQTTPKSGSAFPKRTAYLTLLRPFHDFAQAPSEVKN